MDEKAAILYLTAQNVGQEQHRLSLLKKTARYNSEHIMHHKDMFLYLGIFGKDHTEYIYRTYV